MRNFAARFMTVPRIIIGTLILISIALNFANVIGRYVFFSPIIWAEEVMIFIMVWCVFIGAIPVSHDGRHLKMDLLSANLKPPLKQIVNAFAVTVLLIVCGFVAVQSYKATSLFARLGQESTVAGIPMVIPHASLLIGFVLIIIAVAARFRHHISGQLDSDVEDIVQEFDEDKQT
ncbi:MAG: TRAP transporter small permease [Rhodospirillales bacterium]|jgi:TRAP-type C4-dicarboxylate transport system permease small subunit|nr:TRAP transporter small permease [Rhodospirillales bacterium]MDP6646449.1 TRAP transporter small permease [Rhodospirillales bacterium]|tara:strand:+ start:212 stop:736 length:525 start_codon:yes stop_codon:yes gene_type:complete